MAPFCEGNIDDGVCNAVIAEVADGPVVEATDCGRAVDMPDMGSDLFAGQRLRAGRFLAPQSPPLFDETPLTFAEDAEMVDAEEVEETCDDSDEEEFDLCAVFRGMTIFENSSALIELMPFVVAPLVHPPRDATG